MLLVCAATFILLLVSFGFIKFGAANINLTNPGRTLADVCFVLFATVLAVISDYDPSRETDTSQAGIIRTGLLIAFITSIATAPVTLGFFLDLFLTEDAKSVCGTYQRSIVFNATNLASNCNVDATNSALVSALDWSAFAFLGILALSMVLLSLMMANFLPEASRDESEVEKSYSTDLSVWLARFTIFLASVTYFSMYSLLMHKWEATQKIYELTLWDLSQPFSASALILLMIALTAYSSRKIVSVGANKKSTGYRSALTTFVVVPILVALSILGFSFNVLVASVAASLAFLFFVLAFAKRKLAGFVGTAKTTIGMLWEVAVSATHDFFQALYLIAGHIISRTFRGLHFVTIVVLLGSFLWMLSLITRWYSSSEQGILWSQQLDLLDSVTNFWSMINSEPNRAIAAICFWLLLYFASFAAERVKFSSTILGHVKLAFRRKHVPKNVESYPQ